MSEADWKPVDNGATVGTKGSENGVIVRDDEHALGARITLEQGGCTAPYAVTCGIYGSMVHTAFAGDEIEGCKMFEAMRERLTELLVMPNDNSEDYFAALKRFVDEF